MPGTSATHKDHVTTFNAKYDIKYQRMSQLQDVVSLRRKYFDKYRILWNPIWNRWNSPNKVAGEQLNYINNKLKDKTLVSKASIIG